jgi:hypothetical protein
MKSIIEDAIDRKRKLEEQAHEQYKKNCCAAMAVRGVETPAESAGPQSSYGYDTFHPDGRKIYQTPKRPVPPDIVVLREGQTKVNHG